MKAALVTFSITMAALILVYGPFNSREQIPDEKLVSQYDLIIIGKVTRLIDEDGHSASCGAAVIHVDEVLKGSRGIRTVRLWGGTEEDAERSAGRVLLQKNQEGVWLLRKSERPGYYIAERAGGFRSCRELDDIKAILEKTSKET